MLIRTVFAAIVLALGLVAAAGERFRARGVFVLDILTDTVRVDRFSLTCLGPA